MWQEHKRAEKIAEDVVICVATAIITQHCRAVAAAISVATDVLLREKRVHHMNKTSAVKMFGLLMEAISCHLTRDADQSELGILMFNLAARTLKK